MKKMFFLNLLLIIFSSLITTKVFLLYNNTLKENGHWNVSKMELEKGVFGSKEFYTNRQALNKEKLNLGAWHGFQEVIYNQQVNPRIVEFDFLLSKNYYLYFIFNKDKNNFSAVQLSSNPSLPSRYVESLTSGEFTKIESIDSPNLTANEWHHAVFTFNKENIILQIDKQSPINLNASSNEKQFIGFRGSQDNSSIDNVIVDDQLSDRIFIDKFSNYNDWQRILSLSFFTITILNITVYFIVKKFKKVNNKHSFYRLVILNISILFFSIFYLIFIYAYFLNRYLSLDSIFSKLKTKEEQWVESEEDRINKIVMGKYDHESNKKRILFIGTSQTYGAGALVEEEVITNVLENKINTFLIEQREASESAIPTYEIINGGVSGSKSGDLLKLYKTYWINFKPELVFINLTTNDDNETEFRSNLQEFIDINKEKNIKTIFILEANSPEFTPDYLPFHKVMKNVAESNNIMYLNMHDYLKTKNNSGILWWDLVHLTSYGQKLMANYLFDEYFLLVLST